MKKILPYVVSFGIFIVTLEILTRFYNFYSLREMPGRLIHKPVSIMQKWRGLPFKIPVSDGEVIRFNREDELVLKHPFSIGRLAERKSYTPVSKNNSFEFYFIGCSFTFGAGVRDEETLPSAIAKALEVSSHNMGINGSNPIEIYLRLSKLNRDELPKNKKMFVYTFIDDHVRRHTFALPYAGRWGKWMQVYEKKGSEYVALGPFHEVYPIRSALTDQLARSGIMRIIYPYHSPPLNNDEKESFLDVFGSIKEKTSSLGATFLFVIWPGSRITDWIIEGLKKRNISVLDLSRVNLHKLTNGHPYIPVDLHPTPVAYKAVAEILAKELKKSLP